MATVYDFTDPAQAYYVGRNGIAQEDNRITIQRVIFDCAQRSITASDTAVVLDLPPYFNVTGATLRCLTKDASFKTALLVGSTALVKSAACASVGTIIGKTAGVGSSAAVTAINTGASGASIKLNPGAAADTFKGILTIFGYQEKSSY